MLAGVTSSTLATSSETTDALYGVALGAQLVVPTRGQLFLVPEVLLVDKGGSQTSGGASIDADIRTLDVSLLARLSSGGIESRRRFFAFAGPTYGFVLSCDSESGVGGVFVAGDCLDNLNRSDFGATLGAGIDFPSSTIDWGLSLRYQHGISDLQKGAGEVRTRALLLMLSYRL